MIHGHGNDGYLYKDKVVADFSSNVSPWGTPPALMEHLQEVLRTVDHYPEPMGESLAQALGDFHSISPASVIPVNGATEAFYLIAQAFQNKRSLVIYPTFSEYEDACRIFQHPLTFIHRSQFLEADLSQAELIWLCNPNNPTGDLISKEQLEQKIAQYPKVQFVVDEAYMDFTLADESVVPLLAKYQNIIVVKSLTKNFCIPGIRLGYLLGYEDRVRAILKGKMPWSVNSLAIEAGCYILKNYHALLPPLDTLLGETEQLRRSLQAIEGVEIDATQTHYFLCHTPAITAKTLKKKLIQTAGILTRNGDNFRGMGKHTLRIATQLPEKNKLLGIAMQQIFNHYSS